MTEGNSNPTVWITGAGGLVGNSLVEQAPQSAPDWQACGLTRADLDLLDITAVRIAFREQHPGAIIHCAALSKSPDCQANPQLAQKTNVEATALLAELAADIPFIFFSSDLVFDGRKGNYAETDPVGPLSVYAETKVAAEGIVLANPRHTVIRTSLNGGTSPRGDSGFNEQLCRAWKLGRIPKFFVDEYRSPIPAAATAHATWELLNRGATGLRHVAGTERLSRAAIGQLLAARHPELNPEFEVGSLRDYSGAPRAPDTSLNCAKAQAQLSFPLPGLASWLAAHPEVDF